MIWVELLACVVIWLSFWSLIPRDEWWFRGADFPRLQILALGLIAFILMLVWDAPWDWMREVILLGLIAAVAYQLKMVLQRGHFEDSFAARNFEIGHLDNDRRSNQNKDKSKYNQKQLSSQCYC